MVTLDQANILDLGANLDNRRRPLHFQIFDHTNRVSVVQLVAKRILPDSLFVNGLDLGPAPLMVTFWADELTAIFIGVF